MLTMGVVSELRTILPLSTLSPPTRPLMGARKVQ